MTKKLIHSLTDLHRFMGIVSASLAVADEVGCTVVTAEEMQGALLLDFAVSMVVLETDLFELICCEIGQPSSQSVEN